MDDEEQSVVGTSPPPRKSDVLFGITTDWQSNACVSGIDNAIVYQKGYRRAALHLVEYVCETEREQDSLIFPIVYLYRHHIELTLKSIVRTSSFVTDYTMTEKELDILGRHDLDNLWSLARPMLNPVCELGGSPAFPQDDLEGIDSYILQLDMHDPDGQRFRYATIKSKGRKKKRLPSLSPDLKYINVREFAIALEKLADYLEAIENWFDDIADAKAEYQKKMSENLYQIE